MVISLSPETLRRIPLFADLNEEALKHLAVNGQIVSFRQGEWLFREGDPANSLYVVLEGTVDIQLALDANRDVYTDVESLVPGDVVGWSTLVEPFVYRMGAIATSDARLAMIEGLSLAEIVDDYPEASCKLMRNLARIVGERLDALRYRFVSMINA
jgi:CRP/FNR family cyclic AMP-dependent transcriptional regulator